MTPNQTIDGVPRASDALKCLTESFRHALQRGIQPSFSMGDLEFFIKTFEELRALLDAPATWLCDTCKVEQPTERVCDVCGAQTKPSAQPQGVPMYQVQYNGGYAGWRDVDAETYTELKDDKRYISRIVYAEQPAPVAVVLPERLPGDDGVCTESHYASGWNTCLDEVTRLNAKPDRSTSVLHP